MKSKSEVDIALSQIAEEIDKIVGEFQKVQKSDGILLKDIIADRNGDVCQDNDFTKLKSYKKKKGIYAFYDGFDNLVYIGKGGTGNYKSHDLVCRIGQELRLYHKKKNSSGTLSKNIYDYIVKNTSSSNRPFLVRKNLDYYTSNKKRYKKYILKWKVRIMSFDKDMNIPINVIEAVLIRINEPKYNLDI